MVHKVLLSFDFGTHSIGIAIGQKLTGTAHALTTIKAQKGIPNWNQIESVIKEWLPNYIVVGLPLNMDGSEQQLTCKVYEFANSLFKRFKIPVALQDERLSTVEAKSLLFERGGYRALKKSQVDSQAAVIILQNWLDTH
ncbi:Holliday junction resolvase RuvX [Pantoea sp. Mhis]|nr:Holliday junction resolvase RuvX [Pantoea sp. Mhis]MXP56690.1 Holliday junction resolvase RuvX [Pantoea sp. Mhis]